MGTSLNVRAVRRRKVSSAPRHSLMAAPYPAASTPRPAPSGSCSVPAVGAAVSKSLWIESTICLMSPSRRSTDPPLPRSPSVSICFNTAPKSRSWLPSSTTLRWKSSCNRSFIAPSVVSVSSRCSDATSATRAASLSSAARSFAASLSFSTFIAASASLSSSCASIACSSARSLCFAPRASAPKMLEWRPSSGASCFLGAPPQPRAGPCGRRLGCLAGPARPG